MDDERIIELYWQRNENAISETKTKYGNFCYAIAYRVLQNNEDAEECVNDTYLSTWNSIPKARPASFKIVAGSEAKVV